MAQGAVVVAAESCNRAVDGPLVEHAHGFVECALLLEALGRSHTAVGQAVELGEARGVLFLVDVHVHEGLPGLGEAVFHLKPQPDADAERGHEQIGVGAAVGRAHFEGLLERAVRGLFVFLRVGCGAHVGLAGPAEGHAHKGGTVAVAPAHVGGRLLMGNKPEIGHRHGVAECGDRRRDEHEAGDGSLRSFRQFSVGHGDALAVLHQAHVDMHAGARLAHGDLGSEGHIQVALPCQGADDPFGKGQLVCCIFGVDRKEFDFVLLVILAVLGEVAHFAVAVLDAAAGLGDELHALGAESVELGERLGFVIAVLVFRRERGIEAGNDVVFQFAHGLEIDAEFIVQGLAGLVKREVRGGFEAFAVTVEIGAEHGERGYLGERIHKCGTEAGHHVKVGAAGLYEREKAGTVDTLAVGEDGVEVVLVVDYEIEGLDAAVTCGIHEIHHLDAVFLDETDDVGLGEGVGRLLEEGYYFVGVQRERHFWIGHSAIWSLKSSQRYTF